MMGIPKVRVKPIEDDHKSTTGALRVLSVDYGEGGVLVAFVNEFIHGRTEMITTYMEFADYEDWMTPGTRVVLEAT